MLESHQLQTTLKPAFQEDFSILLIPKHLHMVLDHREVYFEASFNPHLLKIKLNTILIREAPFFFPIMSSSSINYSSPSPPAPLLHSLSPSRHSGCYPNCPAGGPRTIRAGPATYYCHSYFLSQPLFWGAAVE